MTAVKALSLAILFSAWLAPETVYAQAQSKATISVPPSENLIPHKALYEVKMVSGKSGSQMVNIAGKMFYEWKPTCEGWITNHRFSLNYEYADNPSLNVTSDFSTFENFDSQLLNFSSRRKRDGEVYEELRGRAAINSAENGAGKAVYSIPENLSFPLDPGTLFPTAHTMKLLQQAKSGKKFFTARIFDGSDSDGAVDITSFISDKNLPPDSIAKKSESYKPVAGGTFDQSLIAVPSWKVRMAFFPIKNKEATSDYELSMVFHENGIIGDMVIEYADFSVSQKLVALERIAPPNCKN